MTRRTTVIRLLRIASGMPQFEVADAALLDPAKLSRIERGLCLTTPAEMERILNVLGPRAASALPTAEQLIDLLDPEDIEV